jgi:hypothetical protein
MMVKYVPQDGQLAALGSYIGGTGHNCDGTTTALTIPSGANMAYIHAEGGAVYWHVNSATAGTTSPGYVAQDQNGLVFEIDNFANLSVYGGSAVWAHVEFYQF